MSLNSGFNKNRITTRMAIPNIAISGGAWDVLPGNLPIPDSIYYGYLFMQTISSLLHHDQHHDDTLG